MARFLEAIPSDEARRLLSRFPAIARLERVELARACGRVLASDQVAPEPMPRFDRALMDGYAVSAPETYGASETAPIYLQLAGRIPMGSVPPEPLLEGSACEVSTGGALPAGASAVVMGEYCREISPTQVEIGQAVGPGENVLRAHEDIALGARLLARGHRLQPRDVLVLAALGIERVEVFARPRVAVLSTGDELVPVSAVPAPGQVRDANGVALAAQIVEAGGEAWSLGIERDSAPALHAALARALPLCDALFVSGGSSQGVHDSTAQVLDRFGPPGVLAHGIAIAPGKPTLLAAQGDKPLIGLPGHPVASLVVMRLFMNPLLRTLGGEQPSPDPFPSRTRARLSRAVASKPGREEWMRVALRPGGMAEPLLRSSAALSAALQADGLVCIPREAEGLGAGEEVEVVLW